MLSQATAARQFLPRPNPGAIPKLAFNARLLGGLFMGSLAATATLPRNPESDSPRPWWRNPFMQLPTGDTPSGSGSMQQGSALPQGQRVNISQSPGLPEQDPLIQWATAASDSSRGRLHSAGDRRTSAAAREEEDAALLVYASLGSKRPAPESGSVQPLQAAQASKTQNNASPLWGYGWLSRNRSLAGSQSHPLPVNPSPEKSALSENDAALLAYVSAGNGRSEIKQAL